MGLLKEAHRTTYKERMTVPSTVLTDLKAELEVRLTSNELNNIKIIFEDPFPPLQNSKEDKIGLYLDAISYGESNFIDTYSIFVMGRIETLTDELDIYDFTSKIYKAFTKQMDFKSVDNKRNYISLDIEDDTIGYYADANDMPYFGFFITLKAERYDILSN